ncbi:MAG: copper resistance protein CopC [Actinomycetota bacterium]
MSRSRIRGPGWPVRSALVAALAVVLTGLWAAPASAHAALESSTPRDGAILETSPSEILLRFSEPPDLGISEFDLLDASGGSIELGGPRAPGNGLVVTLPVPDLGDGSYTLGYRVTSTVDGHTTGDALTFGIGQPPGVPASTAPSFRTPSPSPLSVAGRWLLYVGLAMLVSATSSWFLVFRRRPPGLVPVLVVSWIVAAAGAVAVTAAAASAADTTLAAFIGSSTGGAFVRQGLAVLVCGGAVVAAIRHPSARTVAVVGGAAAVALLFHTLGGHAGAARDARWLAVGVQWVHVVAAGVWAGGLGWLVLGARRLDSVTRPDAIRGFSRLAGIALVLVFVTGSLRSIDLLGGFGEIADILATAWGTTLAIKLAVVATLVALGAWNRFRELPGLGTRGERGEGRIVRNVGFEVLLAAGVFGVTGVLAGLPPADEARAVLPAPPPHVVVEGRDFATSVRVRLTVTPARPGPNLFRADVVDFDTGAPIEAERVTLRLALAGSAGLEPIEVALTRDGSTWAASSTGLSIAGRWEGPMLIERSGDSVEVPLEIPIESAPQRVTVTPGTGELPDLTTIELGDGRSVQAYLDPDVPGPGQVHVTAFDADGQELPLTRASLTATPPAGDEVDLDAIRLSPGHFVAAVTLTAGTWRFELDAEPRTGASLSVAYEQEVSG